MNNRPFDKKIFPILNLEEFIQMKGSIFIFINVELRLSRDAASFNATKPDKNQYFYL